MAFSTCLSSLRRPFFVLFSAFFLLIFSKKTAAQPTLTADEFVPDYEGYFLAGVNPGAHPPITDERMADFAAGNPALGIEGCGVQTLRPGLTSEFLEYWGYDIRVSTFQHYAALGMKDHTVIVGFPPDNQRDPNFYCPTHRSALFDKMYEPIWDGGANGTPVNDANHAALYFWKMATRYKNYVRFWEIWNEPGFDYTHLHGFSNPGQPGNWWDADPAPCDYKLRAPIQHYVRLLRIAYEVIKSVDNKAFILCGGVGYPSFLDAILRNTDNPNGGSVTPDFPRRGGAYFDAVGYHSYPHFDSSTRTFNDTTMAFDYFRHSDGAAEGVSVVKNRFVPVLKKWGYDGSLHPEKLWLVTEINVPSKAFPEFGMGGDILQRNFILKSYVQCLKENFTAMHVYALEELQDEPKMTFEFDAMGLFKNLSPNHGNWQTRTQGGLALKTASDVLGEKTFDAAKTEALALPPGVGGAAVKDANGRYTYALWAKTKIDQSEQATATYSFPQNFENQTFTRREWDFGTTGAVEIWPATQPVELTSTPIFFTEKSFNQTAYAGCAPLSVTFESPAYPLIYKHLWVFDGVQPQTSTDANPTVVFEKEGEHRARFQLYDLNNNFISEISETVRVTAAPQANFQTNSTDALLHFENLSLPNADHFLWDFGDGTTSEQAVPSHIFYEDGSFTVSLTATNECGTHTFSTTYDIQAPTTTEVLHTALDSVAPFLRPFRPGAILRFVEGWSDEQLADIAAGNALVGQEGAGVRAGRFVLPQYFFDFWGYDIRRSTFQHYANLDLADNIAVLGFPNEAAQETYRYCETDKSVIFKDLYKDIWDGGANATPVNEDNPFAAYVWKTVLEYRDYVEFWQVYDAADYDISGKRGWLPPGEPGSWWDHDPEPCDLSLRGPIEQYVRMLRIAYEIVQVLDPEAYVLLGGIGYPSFLDALLRNTDNPDGGSVHPRYPRTGGAYFDAIGFNAYPFVDGSTSFYDSNLGTFVYQRHSDAAAEGIFSSRQKFENVLKKYGFDGQQRPAKKWLVTEANTPRKKFSEFFSGEIEQRNYLTKAMVEAMAGGFVLFNVNNLSETKPFAQASSPDDAMGLYEFHGDVQPYGQTLTPGGVAFKTASSLLFRTTFDPVRTQLLALPTGVAGYAFRDAAGKFVYVFWAKTTTDQSESANATYSFPTALAIQQLFRKQWDWSATKAQTTVGPLSIPLDGSPIFLTETENPLAFPLAAFEGENLAGCPTLTAKFTDKSANAQTWTWHFPGGVPEFSSDPNPSVTYSVPGIYDVSLTVSNTLGSHTSTQLAVVEAWDLPLAKFSLKITDQLARFENLSTDVDSIKWILHDGSVVFSWVFEKFYFDNGDYPITLVAYGPCGNDTSTQIVSIQAAPVAIFNIILPQECGQFYAAFQSFSGSSPDSQEWFIPGGSPSHATTEDVWVVFPGPGTYSATLVVTNAFGVDTLTKIFSISNAVYHQEHPLICETDSVVIAGQVFSAANPTGEVLFPGGSVMGCDSIVQVELQFIHSSTTDIFDTIPANTGYPFCGDLLTKSGIYSCTLEGFWGCDSVVTLYLSVLVSEQEPDFSVGKWSVFPNPFSERLTVTWEQVEAGLLTLEICAPTGQILRQVVENQFFTAGENRLEVDVPGLPEGVYFLIFKTENGQFARRVVRM